ncbi:hypothetical protein VC82_68 [Flagellimonas lutaonensis]|uniref:Uncharacterized protein n=1 Tax=Flagellimonas lutaonensis TaxID=516051 RepID=A0A0D5YN59_9FLAO|nr:hypothetical protein VC82_68 [Allomuricauda lutaonensis]|tara:strand:- start:157 stop:342 length:186 start_codon:yes stop_codon:yes gene_type:complete
MALESEWQLPMAERFLPEEGPKEERNCLFHLSQDIRNNDIATELKKGVTFNGSTFFLYYNE